MLGLPPTTQVKRSLPKAQLFKRFDWTASEQNRNYTDWIFRLVYGCYFGKKR